ncbi:2-oxoglutarate dehydrogenase E1 component [Streptomyces californicus]
MGFEYGYSLARPESLVIWEAQFGDFVNGAQTVVDEFISSAEQKWGQTSGVTLLLPHGYEGQGPDHSSARPERFLQMCAQDNMTVAMPTLPSNYFHLLRWQVHNPHHKPLIVFTPKSMLRLKAAASSMEEFTSGGFRPVIGDSTVKAENVRKVVFVSGKLFYDLDAEREKRGDTETAIIRLERLYPLPGAEIQAEIAKYPNAEKYLWAQEEPANQGAWPFIALNLIDHLDLAVGADVPHGERLRRISRPRGCPPRSVRPSATRPSRRSWSTRSSKPEDRNAAHPEARFRARRGAGPPAFCRHPGPRYPSPMYFTDRGIEELEKRRGEEEVTFEWLAEQLRTFVDLNPDFEVPVERLATWLARLDDEDDEDAYRACPDNSRLPHDAMHALSPHRPQTQVRPVRGPGAGTPRART